jgi:hypothetical protein
VFPAGCSRLTPSDSTEEVLVVERFVLRLGSCCLRLFVKSVEVGGAMLGGSRGLPTLIKLSVGLHSSRQIWGLACIATGNCEEFHFHQQYSMHEHSRSSGLTLRGKLDAKWGGS